MSHQLYFEQKYNYDASESGVTLEVVLRRGSQYAHCLAKVDTGAQDCLFPKRIAEDLGVQLESGLRKEMSTLTGSFIAFGHEITLQTLNLSLNSFVYFAAEDNIQRSLLGRSGWLQLVRLAIIDYDQELYLSPYHQSP